jgi:hypothetical protein
MKFTLRFFIAAFVLFALSLIADKVTAMVIAGIIMTFPTWKFYRGRFAVGAQGEGDSPELKAIDLVSKQVEGFKKLLGDKLDKTEYDNIKGTIEDLKKSLAGFTDKDAKTVSDAIKTINDGQEKMLKQIGEMQEDIQKTKDSGTNAKKALQLFDEAALKDQISKMFPGGREKVNVGGIKIQINGPLRTKAAEIFSIPEFFQGDPSIITDISAFTGRVIDPKLYERKRKRNFILDNFSIPSIDAPTLVYLEKVEISGENGSQEDTGGAEWITSGAQKPMRSFRVTSNKVEAKKIAIFGTAEDKLLRDVPSLRNWIQTDFTQEIREAYNDGLLNNDPAIDEDAPLGLKTNAVQYQDVAGFIIANPNDIDAIIALIAQLERNNEEASYVVVSSDKWFQLLALKDTQQRYQNNNLVYTSNSGQLYIAGVPIVKADVNDIPTTNVMAVGMDGFQIRNYGPLVFEAGLNGEDFRHDRTSFRAYQEVLSYIASHRYNSVIYDTFANIKTAVAS